MKICWRYGCVLAIGVAGCVLRAGLAHESIGSGEAAQPPPECYGFVGLGESGELEIRGTVIVYERGGSFGCAAHLVLFDQRGGLGTETHPGTVRMGEFNCVAQDDAWVRFNLVFYPGISDGNVVVVINDDRRSGRWWFETGSGVTAGGDVMLWPQRLDDDLVKLSAAQHVERWEAGS